MTSEIGAGSLRQQMIAALERMPDDATFDELIESLFVVQAILEGIREADAGMLIPHEEAVRRMSKWLA